jgi:putative transposase
VTPAARRDAVADLRASLEVSERRACAIIAADRSTVRYRAKRPAGCGSWRISAGGSAIAARMSCCAAKAGP